MVTYRKETTGEIKSYRVAPYSTRSAEARMAKDEKPQSEPGSAAGSAGTQAARILAVLGVNVILVLMVIVFTATERGGLPDLNAKTLQIDLLPVSAALGLILACRRIDLALPAVLGVLFALQTSRHILPDDATIRLAALCGIGAGIGLASALVTWFGRISSALWTALLAVGLWIVAMKFGTWGGFAAGFGVDVPATAFTVVSSAFAISSYLSEFIRLRRKTVISLSFRVFAHDGHAQARAQF